MSRFGKKSENRVAVSCTCPRFEDNGACKHIAAAMLACADLEEGPVSAGSDWRAQKRDDLHRLGGKIEFDEAYFGGQTVGKKRGRGTEKEKVFAGLSLDRNGNPLYLKMKVTENIKQASVRKFAHTAFAEGSVIHSDGYRSYIPALEGFTHVHGHYDPNAGLLHWLHITISNAKVLILGTYHGLPKTNLQSYLDEYCFRFSRRSFACALWERLALAVATSVRPN